MLIQKLMLGMFILLFITTNNLKSFAKAPSDFDPDRLVKQYGIWCSQTLKQPHNDIGSFTSHPDFQSIIEMGVPAIPYLRDMMESGSSFDRECIASAIRKITRKSYLDSSHHPSANINNDELTATFNWIYKNWSTLPKDQKFQKPFTAEWQQKFSTNPTEYRTAYDSWKSLPKGKEKERQKPFVKTLYQQLLDLGIEALPLAIAQSGNGDLDLLDAIDFWTNGNLKQDMAATAMNPNEKPAFCLAWWEEHRNRFTFPSDTPSRDRIERSDSSIPITYNSHAFAIFDSTSAWLCLEMDYDENDFVDTVEYDFFMEEHGFTACPFGDPNRSITAMQVSCPSVPSGFRVTHSGRKIIDPNRPDDPLLESKLGLSFRIAHPYTQLEGDLYGTVWQHYKKK